MGGIAGWVSFAAGRAPEHTVVADMTAALAHRGPVRSIVHAGELAVLGCCQLAGAGHVSDRENESVAVVLSGSIHNRDEVRAALPDGASRSPMTTDAELVRHAYLAWGDELAARLRGRYAIAVWDRRKTRLTLIRDRMGVEPLYFCPVDDGVLFGSEVKALFAVPWVRREVDLGGLRELFAFHLTPGYSPWHGVRDPGAGSIVTVEPGQVRRRTYWQLSPRPHDDDQPSTVKRVEELLYEAVRGEAGDAPPYVMLSGGLDSSVVTGMAARLNGKAGPVHTFSVVTADIGPSPDAAYLHDVVGLTGAVHRDVRVGSLELAAPALRRAVVTGRELPYSWGSVDASLPRVFAAIRAESTAAMSGDVADTVFGFHPGRRREVAESLALPEEPPDWQRPVLRPLRDDLRRTLDVVAYAQGRYRDAAAAVPRLDDADPAEQEMRVASYLEITWCSRTALERVERSAMSQGLEMRFPFCDHRLIEYVHNVPWSMKTFDGREKSLLRHAAMEVLPPSVAWRPKLGYPAAIGTTYFTAIQNQAADLLDDPQHPLFSLVSWDWLNTVARAELSEESAPAWIGLNRVLDLHHWLDVFRPTLVLT